MPNPDHVLFETQIFVGSAKLAGANAAVPVNLNMGQMALSRRGRTNIYSGGFAQCLGVVIIPSIGEAGGRGGMVSHVHMNHNKPGKEKEFLLAAVTQSIAHARGLWHPGHVAVVLFRGRIVDEADPRLIYAELAEDVRKLEGVQEVLDLRPHRELAGDKERDAL